MKHSRITIRTPDGRVHERRIDSPQHATLADWLDDAGFSLNTRCGGRGLCNGCKVSIVQDNTSTEVRACQLRPIDATGALISIPDASIQDQRLNGVSVFEVATEVARTSRRPGVGLALDIGTTTIAAALWDLQTGKCLASGSNANAQRRYGDNVLSRIDHAMGQGGASLQLQQSLVRGSLKPLLQELCDSAGIGFEQVKECVAAGNTVMLHTLLGTPLNGFTAWPFKPAFLESRTAAASDLGLPGDFQIRTAPNPGAFVGADIAVGALASGMMRMQGPAMLIDFGTNGEILLKTEDAFVATATAAGPAFEGGRLSCGAAAGPRVISSLQFTNGAWQPETPEGSSPERMTALSGAAYVDFLAGAVKMGLLGEMGRFDRARPEVVEITRDNESEARVYLTENIFVTEADVAELIQAKAAIAAGAMTLLEQAGKRASDLETLFIAGGFGYHLNFLHAMAIGLMPEVPAERVRIIGNASLGGASLCLQLDDVSELGKLLDACTAIELNQIDSFEDNFIDCMPLAPLDL